MTTLSVNPSKDLILSSGINLTQGNMKFKSTLTSKPIMSEIMKMGKVANEITISYVFDLNGDPGYAGFSHTGIGIAVGDAYPTITMSDTSEKIEFAWGTVYVPIGIDKLKDALNSSVPNRKYSLVADEFSKAIMAFSATVSDALIYSTGTGAYSKMPLGLFEIIGVNNDTIDGKTRSAYANPSHPYAKGGELKAIVYELNGTIPMTRDILDYAYSLVPSYPGADYKFYHARDTHLTFKRAYDGNSIESIFVRGKDGSVDVGGTGFTIAGTVPGVVTDELRAGDAFFGDLKNNVQLYFVNIMAGDSETTLDGMKPFVLPGKAPYVGDNIDENTKSHSGAYLKQPVVKDKFLIADGGIQMTYCLAVKNFPRFIVFTGVNPTTITSAAGPKGQSSLDV